MKKKMARKQDKEERRRVKRRAEQTRPEVANCTGRMEDT